MNTRYLAHDMPQKLVECKVQTPAGGSSIRYVELENYRLWEYMMQNKHKLAISDRHICVWIDGLEFEAKQALYEHAGETKPVSHIVLLIFDESSSYCHTSNRYTPDDDTQAARDAIMSHVSQEILESKRFEIHTHPGYVIFPSNLKVEQELVLGLHS